MNYNYFVLLSLIYALIGPSEIEVAHQPRAGGSMETWQSHSPISFARHEAPTAQYQDGRPSSLNTSVDDSEGKWYS